MAIDNATKEAIWLRSLLGELNIIDTNLPTRLLIDNLGSIHLAKNPLISERAKYIDIRHHFIREWVENQELHLSYCPTSDMIADIFTKPLEKIRYWHFVHGLGLWGESIPVGALVS